MYSSDSRSALRKGLFYCLLAAPLAAGAGELGGPTKASQPKIAPASNEGEQAIRSLKLPAGFKAELVAAEPLLANPVAFHIDERGAIYVTETFRLHAGVTDIRGHMDWLDEDLAARTVDDRFALMRRHLGAGFSALSENSDRIRRLVDLNGDGKIDAATVFADGFNHPMDGIAAGVLARRGQVYFANLPNLWLLNDTNDDGVADQRRSLSYGYGVRVGFLGHDLHGLTFGPDGRLYFSIGDRGSAVKVGGQTIGDPDSGSVFRCRADGSELEVFSFGLRNPQELAFDDHGNLFTGDNNSDGGDRARWVYLVEGGDSGWRVGFQHLTEPVSRGIWNSEKMWHPQWAGQAAFLIPPITNVAAGPSGLAHYPGTGLPAKYQGHFFLADFRGGPGSQVHTFANRPNGAGFDLVNHESFIGEGLPTDVDFGVDGGLYFSDWVSGWNMTGKGRIYRVHEPESAQSAPVAEVKKIRAAGFAKREERELVRLLSHVDQRVRQEAQFELAARGGKSLKLLAQTARSHDSKLARLHALWGLWQLCLDHVPGASGPILPLLKDRDPEIRAQAAKILGDLRLAEAFAGLMPLLDDPEPRARFFAGIALGRLHRSEAVPGLLNLARANGGKDVYLRHAAVMGLSGIGDASLLLGAASDPSPAVRMAVLLALRRLERAEVSLFLKDSDPLLVVEAARAINDVPISGGMSELAALKLAAAASPDLQRRVVNANLRHGLRVNADRLAALAVDESQPNSVRVEALEALSHWEHPSGRDRITGNWRPTAGPREVNHARDALRARIAALLHSGPDAVRLAAARAGGALGLSEAAPDLGRWIGEGSGTARMRVEALVQLARLDSKRLAEALPAALADKSEEVRKEAIKLSAGLKSADPAAPLNAILESGTIGEKQSALAALGGLEAGDKTLDAWLEKLAQKSVPAELQLDLIEAALQRPALKSKAEAALAGIGANDPLKDLNLSLRGGNAAAGRAIFFERADTACQRCHKVKGEGGEVGPDLTGIGARQPRELIMESIAFPNKQIAKGFESVLVKLKNGTVYAGIVKSETAGDLVLNSPEDGIITIKKGEVESRSVGLSGMPEGLAAMLSRQELRNLMEFLASQQ